MTIHDVIEKHKLICNLATDMNLFDALQQTKGLLKEIQNDDLQMDYEHCMETYSNMLKYTMKGILDPQRSLILNALVVRIVEMADKLKELFLEKYHHALQERKYNAYSKLASIQLKLKETI